MPRQLLLIKLVIIFSVPVFSQNISGILKDKTTDQPVKNVVVMLLQAKDSVLHKFTRTNANGEFTLANIAQGSYYLLTTHPVFGDYSDSLTVSKDINMGSIGIFPKAKLLEEVIVKSGSPIRIKGDTVVYTADSFKVKDGANVEELLRRLPGIQVGADGKIKAMGETVKNVLVDGEEFFGSDPGIVTKNLQASAVQEVQVYDKKSDQATFTGIDDGVREKTINLKLKANRKRGYFGKLEAGGGTPDNYSNSAMFNGFMGKRKLSAFGIMSNTGKTDLGWDEAEKFGGGEMEGMTSGMDDFGNTWMSWNNENEYSNGSGGIPKNWNTGIHYSNKYKGDSLSINGSYRYSKINAPGGSDTYSKIFLPDSSWNNNSRSTMFSSKQKQSANTTFESKIDSNNTIKFTAKGTLTDKTGFSNAYEENLNTNGSFINNSNRNTKTDNTTGTFSGTVNWNHKFKKARRTLAITLNTDINDSRSTSNLLSKNYFYKGNILIRQDTVDQQSKINTAGKTYGTNISYTEPLDKYWSLGLTMAASSNLSSNNRNTFTKDGNGSYTVKSALLSNEFDFNRATYRPGIMFRMVKKRISLGIGSAMAFNHFVQDDKTKGVRQSYSFNNFFPSGNLNLTLKKNKNLRISYNGRAQAPTLQQLQPVPDNSNPLLVYTGNADLSQSFTHNVNGNFYWSKPLSDNSIWSGFSYGNTNNAFTQFSTIDTLGRTVYKTVNIDGNQSFDAYADIGTSLGKGKKKIRFSIGPSVDFNRTYDFINGIKNKNISQQYSLNLNFSKYKEDKYSFYFGPTVYYTVSKSSVNSLSNTALWSTSAWADVSFTLKSKTEISVNGNYNFRQKSTAFTSNNNFSKVNAGIEQPLYKKELKLKFSVFDIFNQNRGYNNSFTSYKFTESYYKTLKRYWLLTLTWNFNHQQKAPSQNEKK